MRCVDSYKNYFGQWLEGKPLNGCKKMKRGTKTKEQFCCQKTIVQKKNSVKNIPD